MDRVFAGLEHVNAADAYGGLRLGVQVQVFDPLCKV